MYTHTAFYSVPQCSFLFCLLSNSCSSLHSSVYVTNHFMIVYKSSLCGCACVQQIRLNSASVTVQFVYMCRVNGVGQRAPTVTKRRLFKSCASKQQQRLLLHFLRSRSASKQQQRLLLHFLRSRSASIQQRAPHARPDPP